MQQYCKKNKIKIYSTFPPKFLSPLSHYLCSLLSLPSLFLHRRFIYLFLFFCIYFSCDRFLKEGVCVGGRRDRCAKPIFSNPKSRLVVTDAFSDLSSLSFSLTFFFFFSLYLPLTQPSMVEMWRGTHGSVAGFDRPKTN